MTIAYIGLGSNMDTPKQHVNSAIQALGRIQSTRILNASSLYKTKPVGPQDQDDFVNAVVELDTELNVLDLLDVLQTIENDHKRDRSEERWGPRTLDLDILMYGNEKIQTERLTIPHIEMTNRGFVLVPLQEINPDCEIPGAGPIAQLLDKLDLNGLEKLG